MKQNQILSGNNIYRDKHGFAIYYDKRHQIGYRIGKDREKEFKTYQQRFAIALVAFVFFYILFKLNIYLSIVLSVAVYALLEYRFRKLLSKFTRVQNFKPSDKVNQFDMMEEEKTSKILLRIALYAALSILIVVNAYTNDAISSNTIAVYASYAVSAVGIFFTIKYLLILFKKLNMK